nr:hypothetical protein BaRGS_017864 [Batillaria attramentaria]
MDIMLPFQGDNLEQATDTEYEVLPNIENLEGVNIEGGSNLLTSGGVQLDTNRRLVNPAFRTRNLRSINDSDYEHHHHYHDNQGVGEGSDTAAAHDRKPVTRAQIEAAHKRRVETKATKRADKWKKLTNKTDHTYSRRRKRSAVFDQKAFDRMMRIMRHKDAVTKDNCHTMATHNLILAGDVAYGVHKQFESEFRTALRLSHFLSNFLQNTDPAENFGNLRGGGRLHQEHLFGEVIANVMGNFKVYSSGVYFDRYMFENQDGTKREFFGPWAYRKDGGFYAIDTAGLSTRYVDEEWFQKVKGRWATNFFVDVPLNLLELNQCPQGFGVANAFKNTARCDYESTWCRPQTGFKFMRGAYRCDCRQGFEYHHLDGKFWIEGSLVELEYEKKVRGLFSR